MDNFKIFLVFSIFLFCNFSYGQNGEIEDVLHEQLKPILSQKQLEDKYGISRGIRPIIDLKSLPDSAYQKGIVRVKVTPDLKDFIFRNYYRQQGSEFLLTGNAKLDEINEQILATKYTNLLYTYYKDNSQEYIDSFSERHQAWGFNLIINIEFDSSFSVMDVISKFEALDIVEYAEPVYKIKNHSVQKSMIQWLPNDPYLSQQYALTKIQAFDAWDIVKGNPNIIVAIVDHGIKFQHPDILSNIWPTVGPDENNTLPAQHGTQVAGVLGAVSNNNLGVAGIAGGDGSPSSGIKIMSIDIYNPDGNTYWANGGTFLGQVFAADYGASISNNSWGYYFPDYYMQEDLDGIDYFTAYGGGDVMQGGLVVFSAGNSGENGAYYPAYYGSDDSAVFGPIAVAATDNSDVKWLWSNFGTWIDISAPGVSVFTTNNDNGYIANTGTSFAAPYVSGVAALILSRAYNRGATLTNNDVYEILINSTDNIAGLNYPYFFDKLGSGRLNAFKSVTNYDDCYYFNPINLVISNNTVWSNNVDNKRSIVIQNGANLTISGFTLMQSKTSIIVKNFSILTIDGGSLTKRCGNLWQGITVENGGTLRIINGGQVEEFEQILIEEGGIIEYYTNSQIELTDDESILNIEGNLSIANNATFTFTGNGYVKFSNPGPDATYNITAGTGASVLFSGNGQTDKVLEVQQSTVHFPTLSSLTFENCKIEMGSGKRMQTDNPYPVTFDNVKVTSTSGLNNNHRSFLFSGQSGVTINNSIFEFGQYGIYGNLGWTQGAPLYITNSTFRNNTEGIHIINKGLHFTSVH